MLTGSYIFNGKPTISTFHFTNISESYDEVNGQLVLLSINFLKVEDGGTVYYGYLPIPKKEISFEQAKECLKLVPNKDVYPSLPYDFTTALIISSNEYYIKRPKLLSYCMLSDTKLIAKRFLGEAQTLELIRRNPHPNITYFAGCVVRNNRIISLALTRYSVELKVRIKNSVSKSLDKASCLHGIVAGLKHLHSLELAHNDLNPSNIMLDEQDVPIIIDFGSCNPLGDLLHEGGTPGWNENFDPVSSIRNDETGLGKIQEWLTLEVYDVNVA